MKEVLEGTVGRSVKFEGQEYFLAEPEIVEQVSFALDSWKHNYTLYRYWRLSTISPTLNFGITEV